MDKTLKRKEIGKKSYGPDTGMAEEGDVGESVSSKRIRKVKIFSMDDYNVERKYKWNRVEK